MGKYYPEKNQFEQNAKLQISFWGPDNPGSSLIDYAGKQWSGMLRTYYYNRWEIFFATLDRRIQNNEFSTDDPEIKYFIVENEWAESKQAFDTLSLVTDKMGFLHRLLDNPH